MGALRCAKLMQQGANAVFCFLEVNFGGPTEGSLRHKGLVCITKFCPSLIEQLCGVCRLRVGGGEVVPNCGKSCVGFVRSCFCRSCDSFGCCLEFVRSGFCGSYAFFGREEVGGAARMEFDPFSVVGLPQVYEVSELARCLFNECVPFEELSCEGGWRDMMSHSDASSFGGARRCRLEILERVESVLAFNECDVPFHSEAHGLLLGLFE